MKPPFARIGGKRLLAGKIIDLFPKNYEEMIYVEPFVGAGNIYFRKEPSKKEIINDLDSVIYKVLKLLKNQSTFVNNNIQRNITRSHWNKIKNSNDALSLLEKIKMSYFSNSRSFDTGKEGKTIKTDFSVFGDRLKDTKLLNQDYESVIKTYDSPNTFFYLDPPYEQSETKVGEKYASDFNINDLKDVLDKIQGKFLLSFNYSKNISDLFKKYKQKVVTTTYVFDNRKVKEILIYNY